MRILGIGIAVLVALLAAPALAAPLLDDVDNGSFETWADGAPTSWTVLSGVVSPSSNADSGVTAVVMSLPPGGTVASIAQPVENVLDTVNTLGGDTDLPVIAGTWYEFDFAANLNTGSNGIATANGQVLWIDALGNVARTDSVAITRTNGYTSHSVVLQAPLPGPDDPVPVLSAEVHFTLSTPSLTSPHDVLLFVDSVQFGNQLPPSPV